MVDDSHQHFFLKNADFFPLLSRDQSQCDTDAAEDEIEDVFKKLPEDVIDYIVTFFSIKDLVKMSTVSKSWRHRWKTCPNLDFDFHSLYPKEEQTSKRNQLRYVKCVNQILSSHQGHNIDMFRIRTCLHFKYNAYVDEWIMSAFQKQVKNLVIESYDFGNVSRKYALPSWFSLQDAMFLNHMTLGNVCLGSFEVSCWNNLTSLTLENVFVSDKWVHEMLQNSVCLKRLSLHGCTSLSLTELVIPSHVELEHLSLLDGLKYLCKVVIENGRALESFECGLKVVKSCRFEKVPNIKKVEFADGRIFETDQLWEFGRRFNSTRTRYS